MKYSFSYCVLKKASIIPKVTYAIYHFIHVRYLDHVYNRIDSNEYVLLKHSEFGDMKNALKTKYLYTTKQNV